MNEHKISFIYCTNDLEYQKECESYIKNLHIPEGYLIECIPIVGAASMTAGYNRGQQLSDAKYKIYLHQDVFLVYKDLLIDTIKIFQVHPEIGLLGMVGTKRIPANGCMWTSRMRTGALYSYVFGMQEDFFDIPCSESRSVSFVQAVDGLFMMTQYDIPWREDLFDAWDFYDLSQCMEYARHGYRIGVPFQKKPWTVHDNGYLNLQKYHFYRKRFLQEYFPMGREEIAACDAAAESFAQRAEQEQEQIEPLKQEVISLIRQKNYAAAFERSRQNLERCRENEEYCILYVLLNIYMQETGFYRSDQTLRADQPVIFDYFERQEEPVEWLYGHFHRILHCLWRSRFRLSEPECAEAERYLELTGISGVARDILGENE